MPVQKDCPAQTAIAELMPAFADDFRMVTTQGVEVHRLQGVETARWSVVAMSVTEAGVRWHFLQETAV